MDKKELLKKYWFVGLIAIVLLAFVGVYAVDSFNNREVVVRNRQEDGKYVVYTIDDQPVYADDLYTTLYENNGIQQAIVAYERAIFEKAYETTEEMENNASMSAANALYSYSEDYLVQILKSMGYTKGIDDLKQYFIDGYKQQLAMKDYLLANSDKYKEDIMGTNGHLIYHILVKCDTSEITDEEGNVTGYEAAPTAEQQEKLDQILAALKEEGSSFKAVAYQYSDDGSKSDEGFIGLINEENQGNYYPVFSEASLKLKDNEISEPVVSQAGYHIIWNAASTYEGVVADDHFVSSYSNTHTDVPIRAILAKGKELGFEIVDEDLNAKIEAELGSEE